MDRQLDLRTNGATWRWSRGLSHGSVYLVRSSSDRALNAATKRLMRAKEELKEAQGEAVQVTGR
jgi:hypothetical protein